MPRGSRFGPSLCSAILRGYTFILRFVVSWSQNSNNNSRHCVMIWSGRRERNKSPRKPSGPVVSVNQFPRSPTYTQLARTGSCGSTLSQLEENFWMVWGCGRGWLSWPVEPTILARESWPGPRIGASSILLGVVKVISEVVKPIYSLANRVWKVKYQRIIMKLLHAQNWVRSLMKKKIEKQKPTINTPRALSNVTRA